MRCKNCGWPNDEGVARCVKCNAPLEGSMIDSNRKDYQPAAGQAETPANLKGTVREMSSPFAPQPQQAQPQANGQTNCPNCGYPLSANSSECPVCHARVAGTPAQQQFQHPFAQPAQPVNPNRPTGGTVNPWATPANDAFCTLTRIPWQNEQVQYQPVSYSGQEIILSRANTDSNNNTITSGEQAALIHENGEWFIENRSSQQTTLIRVDRRQQLQDGDVIVLGNRFFVFKKG